MSIFLPFLLVVTGVLFFVKFLRVQAGRYFERMVTNHFKAAEALIELKRLPPVWVEGLERIARSKASTLPLAQPQAWQDRADAYLLNQIGKLRKFFTTCPYVESEESRQHLLGQLDDLTTSWQSSDISQIVQHYGVDLGSR